MSSVSLHTNQASMAALQSLRSIGQRMEVQQRRISSGLRVEQASDNSAYWSISSMMRSDLGTLSAVIDTMAIGKNQVDIAYESVDQIKKYLDNVQNSFSATYEKGLGDIEKIKGDIKGHMSGIKSAVQSAFMSEKNLLASGGSVIRIAGAYHREGDAIYVDMIEVGGKELFFAEKGEFGGDYKFDGNGSVLESLFKRGEAVAHDDFKKIDGDLLELKKTYDTVCNDPSKSDEERKNALSAVNEKIKEVQDKISTVQGFLDTDFNGISSYTLEAVVKGLQSKIRQSTETVLNAGSLLGAAKNKIDSQVNYINKLVDSVTRGIGALVDADMNAESARLSSIQVQQQLAIQSLSIANQSQQGLLALFRN